MYYYTVKFINKQKQVKTTFSIVNYARTEQRDTIHKAHLHNSEDNALVVFKVIAVATQNVQGI